MFRVLERKISSPDSFREQGWDPHGTYIVPPDKVPIPRVIMTPVYGYLRYHEVATNQGKTSRREWNRFEHYKLIAGSLPNPKVLAITSDLGMCSPYSTPINSKQRYGVATHSDPLWAWKGQTPSRQKEYHPYDGLTPTFYSPNWDGEGRFLTDLPNQDVYIQRALDYMCPRIKAEVSLVNFVYELKDFKRLPELLYDSIKFLKKLKGIFRAGWKRITLAETLRLGTSHHLNYSFAIAPLISDLLGIHSALMRTEKRMNALVAHAGRTMTSHFSCEFMEGLAYAETPDYVYNWGPNITLMEYPSSSGCRTKVCKEYKPTQFHAQMKYNFNFTAYQLRHAQLLAMLDAFGIGGFNPAVIWNAIPFSFVVDWFAKVGDLLEDIGSWGAMDPKINIQRFLWSYKRKREIMGYKKLGFPGTQASNWKAMPRYTETAYRREVGVPSRAALVMSGLSLKEFSLGASLITSISLSRSRKRR